MAENKKSFMTYKRKRAMYGLLFISPWLLGFLLFFAKPLVLSLIYTFQNITFGDSGYKFEFIKFNNYIYAFTKDPDFVRSIITAMQNIAYEVPIIIIFSLFIAVVLKQEFRGRLFARAMFFLPVIITSGIIITILKEDVFARAISQGNAQTTYLFKSSGLMEILYNSGLDPRIINYFTTIVNRIFDMAWKSGVQILFFLAGLQTIPRSSYEAAEVEGATAWESFWKITFPLISPIIVVNVVYSIVDSFTDYGNLVMKMIREVGFVQIRYGYSSAMSWIYFLCVFAVIGLVYYFISKKAFYIVE